MRGSEDIMQWGDGGGGGLEGKERRGEYEGERALKSSNDLLIDEGAQTMTPNYCRAWEPGLCSEVCRWASAWRWNRHIDILQMLYPVWIDLLQYTVIKCTHSSVLVGIEEPLPVPHGPAGCHSWCGVKFYQLYGSFFLLLFGKPASH